MNNSGLRQPGSVHRRCRRNGALAILWLLGLGGVAIAEDVTALQQARYAAEEALVTQPYKGITTDGNVVPGLFALDEGSEETAGIRRAATALLDSMTAEQRQAVRFDVDDVQWRRWSNMPHTIYYRRGVAMKDMTCEQRALVDALLGESLSAKGARQVRDIMRVDIYEEGSFWLTILGSPEGGQPWGWQLQGHHLAVNFFVVGDQVVVTPAFLAAEPTLVIAGSSTITSILQPEQNRGLEFVNSLSEVQKNVAVFSQVLDVSGIFTDALQDNLVLDYQGLPASEMNEVQRQDLLALINEYVSNLRDADARRKMLEVERHLDSTYFSWAGSTEPDAVFYYRVHSPVILIEFVHHVPFALPGMDKSKPTRQHIHTIVRTPNGNDYGKELLRQYRSLHGAPATD